MIQARGTVLRVENGLLWLRLEDRPGGCGRCDEPGGCRSTRFGDVFKGSGDVVRLEDSLGAKVGDHVMISAADGAPLQAALLGYGLPLVSMLFMAAMARIVAPFTNPDANVLSGVAAGLFIGAVAGRRILASGRSHRLALSLVAPSAGFPHCGKRP